MGEPLQSLIKTKKLHPFHPLWTSQLQLAPSNPIGKKANTKLIRLKVIMPVFDPQRRSRCCGLSNT